MPTFSRAALRRRAAFFAALAALALAAPAGGATDREPGISPPPRVDGYQMHWFRWQPSTRTLQSVGQFGSTAVVGLESMRDLAALRAAYGLDRVHAIPELHAAEVSVDPMELRALLERGVDD